MTPRRASRRVLAACVAVAVLLGLGGGLLGRTCAAPERERSARGGAAPARREAPRGRPDAGGVAESGPAGAPARERIASEGERGRKPADERDEARKPSDGFEVMGRRLSRVVLSRLDVTEGELRPGPDGRLTVDGPRMRAVLPGATGSVAELRFTVLGPTQEQIPLASGEQRQQVGLKLRALDGCNLVYVMWRLAPKPGIVVNYKRNPGQHTSRECGNRGYTTVRPARHVRLEAPSPGTPHTLRAVIDGHTLRVWADGALAWEGELPEEALAIEGPVGLRSDNVRLALQLYGPLR